MYMAYGMTYEQFWFGDPWMVRAFEQAYLLKRRKENEDMWILGSYVCNAVGVAINNAFNKRKIDYLKKPLDLWPKTEAEQKQEAREERRKLIAYLNRWKASMDRNRKNGGETDGNKP